MTFKKQKFLQIIFNILSKKWQINYHLFAIIFCVISFISYNIINLDKYYQWFNINNKLNIVALSSFFLISLILYILIFLIICHKRTTKFIAIFSCILSTIATYFINKYDISIDRTMIMNTLNTDPSEVHSLLSTQMIKYLFFYCLLPIILILKINIIYPQKYFIKSLKIIIILFIFGIFLGYKNYQSLHLAGNLSRKKIIYMIIPINYIRSSLSAFENSFIKPIIHNKNKNITVTGNISKTENLIVVLAIGETSRQKNFSLYGYDRLTNPLLSKQKNLHILNGKARVGSTLYALPEILVKNEIALTTLTTKLGIDTKCYVNYSLHENCTVPGEIKVNNCKRGKNKCFDEDVIPYLEADLKSYKSAQKLIVLHIGGGSHGPSYHERYPDEFQIFNPICKDADIINKCTKEELYNTFDNTILYVDYVVDKIIKTLDNSKHKYVFLYLSDHGESLLEDGRLFHGMPPGFDLPPEQAQIPLLVKSSIPISIKKFESYSQPQIYETIMDLLNISSDKIDKSQSFIIKK